MAQYALPPGFTPADAPAAAAVTYNLPPGFTPAEPETNQSKYDAALATVRRNEFPGMSDEQFSAYSRAALAPYSLNDEAQQGQTMGFGDEIAAGVGAFGNQVRKWVGLAPQPTLSDQVTGANPAPDFGQAYGDLEKLEQARRDLGADKNGWLSTAANVVGGLSSFGPEKAALDATVDAGRAAAAGITAAPAAAPAVTAIKAPLWQQAAKSAAIGAPIGAVGGFGSADEDRLGSAAGGALVGGAIGAVVPYAAQGISSAYRNVADALFKRQAANSVGLDPGVASFLQRTLGADGSLSADGQARMAAAGPEGMLADAGPSARAALDTAIQSNGEAGQLAREQIGERASRSAAAVTDAMNNAMGRPQGLGEMRANIAAASAPERAAAYDAAYSSPIDYSSHGGRDLETMLTTRVDGHIINSANTLMRRNGEASHQILAKVADDGSVTYKTLPDTRQIDYITRALNDKADQNAGLGKLGGQTAEGRSFQNLASDLRGTLRAQVPAYGDALDAAADPIQRSQAVKFGYSALDAGTTRDEVALHMNGITPGAAKATAQGVRSNIDDMLANVTRTVQDGDVPAREAVAALRKLSTRAAREKLQMIVGEQPANEMLNEVDRAARSFDLRAAVADNSKTFARLEQKEAVRRFAEGGENPFQELAKGEVVNAAKKGVRFLTGETASSQASRADAFQRQIAEALLQRGGGATRTMQSLARLNSQTHASHKVAQALLSGATNVGNAGRNIQWQRQSKSGTNP